MSLEQWDFFSVVKHLWCCKTTQLKWYVWSVLVCLVSLDIIWGISHISCVGRLFLTCWNIFGVAEHIWHRETYLTYWSSSVAQWDVSEVNERKYPSSTDVNVIYIFNYTKAMCNKRKDWTHLFKTALSPPFRRCTRFIQTHSGFTPFGMSLRLAALKKMISGDISRILRRSLPACHLLSLPAMASSHHRALTKPSRSSSASKRALAQTPFCGVLSGSETD